jgi:hypothetical protein
LEFETGWHEEAEHKTGGIPSVLKLAKRGNYAETQDDLFSSSDFVVLVSIDNVLWRG